MADDDPLIRRHASSKMTPAERRRFESRCSCNPFFSISTLSAHAMPVTCFLCGFVDHLQAETLPFHTVICIPCFRQLVLKDPQVCLAINSFIIRTLDERNRPSGGDQSAASEVPVVP